MSDQRTFVSFKALFNVGGIAAAIGLVGGFVFGVIIWTQYSLAPVAVVVGIIGVGAFVRAMTIRFAIESDGLFVRNYFRTSTLRWPEIAEVGWRAYSGAGTAGAVWGLAAAAIKTRDGALITATATAGCGRSKAEQLAQALNDAAGNRGINVSVTAGDLTRGARWPKNRDNPPLS